MHKESKKAQIHGKIKYLVNFYECNGSFIIIKANNSKLWSDAPLFYYQ